jgi:hypothetical protein
MKLKGLDKNLSKYPLKLNQQKWIKNVKNSIWNFVLLK